MRDWIIHRTRLKQAAIITQITNHNILSKQKQHKKEKGASTTWGQHR